MVNDGDACPNPLGLGLVLQPGEDLPVGLSGLVRPPGVLLPVGLSLDGDVHPQRAGAGGRALVGADDGGQDTVGPGGSLLTQAADIPVGIQRPDDAAGVVPRLVV